MTEQGTTKEECHVCDTPDGDHLDWCTPQAREQRPSKEWMARWAALQLANESTQSIAASTLCCELVAENARLSKQLADTQTRERQLVQSVETRDRELDELAKPAHEPPAVPVAWLRRFRDGTYDVFHDRPRNSDVSDRKPWRVVPLYERAAPPEAAPTAWMRGHRSYSPGEPDDYDVECVYGDDPPDDSGKWIPLYRRAAQPPEVGQ